MQKEEKRKEREKDGRKGTKEKETKEQKTDGMGKNTIKMGKETCYFTYTCLKLFIKITS